MVARAVRERTHAPASVDVLLGSDSSRAGSAIQDSPGSVSSGSSIRGSGLTVTSGAVLSRTSLGAGDKRRRPASLDVDSTTSSGTTTSSTASFVWPVSQVVPTLYGKPLRPRSSGSGVAPQPYDVIIVRDVDVPQNAGLTDYERLWVPELSDNPESTWVGIVCPSMAPSGFYLLYRDRNNDMRFTHWERDRLHLSQVTICGTVSPPDFDELVGQPDTRPGDSQNPGSLGSASSASDTAGLRVRLRVAPAAAKHY